VVIEVLTGLLVLITGFYAWATLKILRANERVVEAMYEQQVAATRPYIVVAPSLEVDNPIFYLRIANEGKSAALNLKLSIDKSFFQFGERAKHKDISTLPLFNNVITSMAPGAEVVLSLAQSFKVFAGGETEQPEMPRHFTVSAEYEFADRKVHEAHVVDLGPYYGANVAQDAYVRKLSSIAESLDKLAKRSEGAA
jgi:hypothetical protein